MADKPFRVLLDLTDLYVENYKYVWMNVSPRELRTISDFRVALLSKINLDREDIKLFVRDGLLLEQETTAILREDDTVKVQYEDSSHLLSAYNSAKESKRSSRKRNCEYNADDHNAPLNKRKCKIDIEISKESKESSFLEASGEKTKKHKKLLNPVYLDNVVDHSENLGSDYTTLQSQKKRDKKKATGSNLKEKSESFFSFSMADTTAEQCENKEITEKLKSDNLTFHSVKKPSPKINGVDHQKTSEMAISESFVQETVVKKAEEVNNCPKKKRKRHRKRKKTESSITEISCGTKDKFTSFPENMDEDVKRKHIVYSPVLCEKDPLVISHNENGFQNSPKDTFVINKNISTVSTQSFKDYPKVSTPTQEGSFGNPSWQVSLTRSRNSVFNNELSSQNEVTHDKLVVQEVCLQNSEENKSSSEIPYDDLPAVNSIPEVGTSIAYKTLELDESYSPVISEYREGVVKNIKPDTEEVEIELLKHVIKPGRTGKFENLKKDEAPLPDIKKHDIVRWSDVISPKHLS